MVTMPREEAAELAGYLESVVDVVACMLPGERQGGDARRQALGLDRVRAALGGRSAGV